MRDAGITDEPVKILLAHGNPAAINEIAESEPRKIRDPLVGGLGDKGKSDTDKTVQPELF